MNWNDDFSDMLSALSETGAEFMIVGAYAMAAHGVPRATGDIDIVINATPENAERVFAALTKFGAPLEQLTLGELSTPGLVFQIGLPPRRIDILTRISGVEFSDAWERRKVLSIGGLTVPCLGLSDLIANKRATGRPKDIADLAYLVADMDDPPEG